MSTELPECETLALRRDRSTLYVTLDRPEVRNAMSFAMVTELMAVFERVHADRNVRAIVLRGAGGHFCAGGDIKDMARLRSRPLVDGCPDPIAEGNRKFGTLLTQVDSAPQAVIAVLEGTVMGGGFGLACVSDVAIADAGAIFRLPETGLGLPPAQVAPFIAQRIGLTQARRLAVTGGRIDAAQAVAMGLVHEVADPDHLADRLREVLADIARCAPGAVAATKELMLATSAGGRDAALDRGARLFAEAIRSSEGEEGMIAFIQKRRPSWDDRRETDSC